MIVKRASINSVDFDGLRVFDYTVDQNARSSLAVVEVPPGGRHREAYSKRSEKYYYVVSGQIAFSLDGDEHDLTAGDLCLVDQGQHFSCVNRTQDVARLLLMHTPSFDLESEVVVDGRRK